MVNPQPVFRPAVDGPLQVVEWVRLGRISRPQTPQISARLHCSKDEDNLEIRHEPIMSLPPLRINSNSDFNGVSDQPLVGQYAEQGLATRRA